MSSHDRSQEPSETTTKDELDLYFSYKRRGVSEAKMKVKSFQATNSSENAKIRSVIYLGDSVRNRYYIQRSMLKFMSLCSGSLIELRLASSSVNAVNSKFSKADFLDLLLQLPKDNNLQVLSVDGITFTEKRLYWRSRLKKAIQHLSKLRQFRWASCKFGSEELDSTEQTYNLAASLSKIPCLERVDFQCQDSDSLRTAIKLCECSNLQSLDLKLPPSSSNFLQSDFFDSIKAHSNLKHLSLKKSTPFSSSDLRCIGDMLENNTSLQTLDIPVATGASIDPLVKSLSTNNCALEELICSVESPVTLLVSEDVMNAFISALQNLNFDLKYLYIFKAECFKEVSIWGKQKKDEIDMFLRLNRVGRKRLFAAEKGDNNSFSVSADTWLEVLTAAQEDITSLYYLLLQYPEIVTFI